MFSLASLGSESAGHPFGDVVLDYDAAFTNSRLGRWLRDGAWERLAVTFRPGDRVLELGCGTGEDAIWLAQRGVQVIATDVSAAMLEVARRKACAADMEGRAHFQVLDLGNPRGDDWTPGTGFDGALSNFGALNCLPERRSLARELGSWVRPGGCVVLVVMGPWCPWEIGWHLLHGEVRVAFRRFRAGALAHVGGRQRVRVWYPSPRRLRCEFAPYFRHRETVGLGAFLPPSYLGFLVERWPRLFARLAWLDHRLGRTVPWTGLNDHYLMVLERR